MKKGTKLGIGLGALLLGAVLLSGCTNSFCSTVDRAHILYGIEHGVCEYYDSQELATANAKHDGAEGVVGQVPGTNVWYNASVDYCGNLGKINTNAIKSGIRVPTINYFIEMDNVVLNHAIEAYASDNSTTADAVKGGLTADMVGSAKEKTGILTDYGYLKFYGPEKDESGNTLKESKKLYLNLATYTNEARMNSTISIDECTTADYAKYYQTQLNNTISSYRSCLATRPGYYGKYGAEEIEVQIQQKPFSWAWNWKAGQGGLLSGLIVWPIGALIDVTADGFANTGMAIGWANLLAIFFTTLIVRSLMLLATFKQTTSSNKMQELQPEIAKIQAKYPNSNTNQYEKQRMAQETQALYKKHKINPLTSILIMIVQFPVFICVWGAMQGSATLSSGEVLGLNLSQSISSVLTTWSNWRNPASGVWTALVLFLLMSGAQTVAMLLPQWLQKAKKKKIAKLGRNPAQKESDNKMKWFTYIMLAMIIFMGFSLVSALGVYWLVGALFSIAQTLITHAVMNRKPKKK